LCLFCLLAVLRFFMRMNNVSAATGEAMMDLLTKNKMVSETTVACRRIAGSLLLVNSSTSVCSRDWAIESDDCDLC
jgi:hypothetical protein